MAVRRIDGGRIEIGGASLPVEVRVDPRARRLILRLGRERRVTVTCPSARHVSAALEMVKTRRDWLSEQLAHTPAAVPFAIGSTLPVFGIDRRVVAAPRRRAAATLTTDEILVGGETSAQVAHRIETMLRRHVRNACRQDASAFAAELNVTIGGVSVRQMTSRWGSCAVDGSLSFNWRLVFAPRAVLTYVIVHEVAHRREMNHSRQFWRIVEMLDPDYLSAATWLKSYGATLHAFGQGTEKGL